MGIGLLPSPSPRRDQVVVLVTRDLLPPGGEGLSLLRRIPSVAERAFSRLVVNVDELEHYALGPQTERHRKATIIPD